MSQNSELEHAARAEAVERIAGLIQRPAKLEKVDEFKKREERKMAPNKAMLKTALNSQLEDDNIGLDLLKKAREDLAAVGNNLTEIQKSLNTVPILVKELLEIRQKSFYHSQLEMAMENINNIFNINNNVESVKTLIDERNLLQAHLKLTELETSRDELLFELPKFGNKSEQTILISYFSVVEKLSDYLWGQLVLNLKRTLKIVQKEPEKLVTTLRIIEREEKADEIASKRYNIRGFLPPGRPKNWRKMALEILEASVKEKLEAIQLENRAQNKMWLVRYLEVTRIMILEDLSVVKALVVPCFPPSYGILELYLNMYHTCLSKLLEGCISKGLEGFEYAALLSWVFDKYKGKDLLGSTQLNLQPEQIPKKLLSNETIQHLKNCQLSTLEGKYRSWRTNALKKEVEEFLENTPPQSDSDGHFYTETPIIIFKMVEENLQLANKVGSEFVQEVLLISLDMIKEYGQAYDNEVTEFKTKFFKDRSKIQNFTFCQFTIGVANNCINFIDLSKQTKDKYLESAVGESKAAQKFETVQQTFESLGEKTTRYLLEGAFLDIEPHFQEVATRSWLESRTAIDNICIILESYFQECVHLKTKNFELVMCEGKNIFVKKYLLALMSRKLALKNQEERRKASEKIFWEAEKIRGLFERFYLDPKGKQSSCPFVAIQAVAEVIKVEDLDILTLEVHSFIKRYPDLTKEQLMAILGFRGDIGRFELKQRASDIISNSEMKCPVSQTIFHKFKYQLCHLIFNYLF